MAIVALTYKLDKNNENLQIKLPLTFTKIINKTNRIKSKTSQVKANRSTVKNFIFWMCHKNIQKGKTHKKKEEILKSKTNMENVGNGWAK